MIWITLAFLVGLFTGGVFGLKEHQATIDVLYLLKLNASGELPLDAHRIAEMLKIPVRRVYVVLASLERHGYIEGSPDPTCTPERLAMRGGRAPLVWRVKG